MNNSSLININKIIIIVCTQIKYLHSFSYKTSTKTLIVQMEHIRNRSIIQFFLTQQNKTVPKNADLQLHKLHEINPRNEKCWDAFFSWKRPPVYLYVTLTHFQTVVYVCRGPRDMSRHDDSEINIGRGNLLHLRRSGRTQSSAWTVHPLQGDVLVEGMRV